MEEVIQGNEMPEQAEVVEPQGEVSEDVQEEVAPQQEADKEAVVEGKTSQEKVEVLKDVFGLSNDDFILDKSGDLKIIQKISGKKYLVTPQQLMSGFNIAQAGYKNLNDAKQKVKEVEDFHASMKENPDKLWELADKLGIDKHGLAEQLLQGKLNEFELTPEQREKLEWEKKYNEKDEENKKLKDAEQKRQLDIQKQEHTKKYDLELTAAMRKHGFSESNKETKSHVLVGAIQKLMLANQSGRDLSSEDAVFLAKQEWQEHVQGFFGEIDEDHILKIVPDNIVQAIRKADLGKLKTGTLTANKPLDSGDQQVDLEEYVPPAKQKQSMSDYFHNLK